jgi:hypothetical protein
MSTIEEQSESNSVYEYLDSELQHSSQMVLCIEELDGRCGKEKDVDTRLFILYDYESGGWHIFGKRTDTKTISSVPFKFFSFSRKDIWVFIEFVVGKTFTPTSDSYNTENCNVMLYNYNNLNDYNLDDLTYEFFENNMDNSYEISGYDEILLRKKFIYKMLHMLEKFYNITVI